MNITAEDIIYMLYNYYEINNNIELAKKINTTPQTITNWKSRNSVNAIKKKCREIGIYNDIFGDIQKTAINNGFMTQNLNGNINQNQANIDNEIDTATYTLFKEAYQEALDKNEIKKLRIYLMDYQ